MIGGDEVMDFEKLPMILTPKDVQKALELDDTQKDQVYRLFRSKKFPAEKIGGKYIIPKPRFLQWLGATNSQA